MGSVPGSRHRCGAVFQVGDIGNGDDRSSPVFVSFLLFVVYCGQFPFSLTALGLSAWLSPSATTSSSLSPTPSQISPSCPRFTVDGFPASLFAFSLSELVPQLPAGALAAWSSRSILDKVWPLPPSTSVTRERLPHSHCPRFTAGSFLSSACGIPLVVFPRRQRGIIVGGLSSAMLIVALPHSPVSNIGVSSLQDSFLPCCP